MKIIKTIFAAVVITSLSITSVVAQKKVSKELTTVLKGLEKASEAELQNMQIMLDGESTPVYDSNGKRVRGMEMMSFLTSGDYMPDFYLDKDKEMKAVVLRKSSDEEKLKMQVMQSSREEKSDLVGTTAKDFSATDIHGNTYSMDDLKGKVIVMNFWFVECKPCVAEMPELNEVVEKYHNNDEVVFLGFALNDKKKLDTFLKKNPFDYNVIPDSRMIAGDYGVSAYPTHIIVGKDSKVEHVTTGLSPTTVSDVENKIKTLLKK